MDHAIPFSYTGMVDMFGEYMLKQSVLARAVPKVGDSCLREAGINQILRQNFVPALNTSG